MTLMTLAILTLLTLQANAQRISVATNAVEWANLGTVNAEAGVAVSKHFSVHAGFRYNPWTFNQSDPLARFEDPLGERESQFQNRKQAYELSLRYWPWYVYSGWWFSLKGQYMEYDRGGIFTRPREAGDSYGAGLMAGYSYILHKNWNIEFGIGAWGGYNSYGSYRCTNCGQPVAEGTRFFFMPDDVKVSLVLIF